MTKEQKIEAVRMRLDGMSLEEIGKKMGCSRQNVSLMLKSLSSGGVGKRGAPLKVEAWARPALAVWLNSHRMTIPELAWELGIKSSTLRTWFRTGGRVPYYRNGVLADISEATGIPTVDLLRKRGEA